MSQPRRFPPPWAVEDGGTYFAVKDSDGQALAYVYFDDPRAAATPLTRDEATADRNKHREATGKLLHRS